MVIIILVKRNSKSGIREVLPLLSSDLINLVIYNQPLISPN